jgi:two-component system LytT family response regulator
MRKIMKALIIEDMPQAQELLLNELATHCPEVEIIGIGNSVVQGAKLLRQHMPDIIFLDILLGDGTGFDLLEIFPDMTARVIFITASDEFALRAFRFAAIDYLLKPIDPEQLKSAVARAKQVLATSQEQMSLLRHTIRHPDTLPDRISLHTHDRISVVMIADIIRCESDGNNTWFFLKGGDKILVTRTLKQYDQLLEKHPFIRVHQSHLVNIDYLQEFIKRDGGYLKLKNGDMVPVAVRKKQEVLDLLQQWG